MQPHEKKTTTELQRPLAAVGAMGLGCRSRVWAGTSTCQQLPGLGHGAKTASPQCHPCTVGLAESISSINNSWVSLSWFCALFYSALKKKKIEKLSYLNSYFKLSICLNGKSCKRGVSGQVRGLKSLNEPGGWWQQQGQAGTEAGAQAKQKWSWGEAVVLERGIQDK